MADHKIALQPFMVPNYVLTVAAPRTRQEGFTETPKFALSELSAETLAELCETFTAEVFAKAGKSRP